VTERARDLGAHLKLGVTSFDSGDALTKQLKSIGFAQVEIYKESKVFWHESGEEWWDSLWSHSLRFRLEQLSSEDLERLKEEALLKVGKGKVSDERHVLYAIGR
jgi:hypothetical protein